MNLVKNKFKKKIKNNLIDTIDEVELKTDFHYKKTLDLWGLNNHKKNKKNIMQIKRILRKLF